MSTKQDEKYKGACTTGNHKEHELFVLLQHSLKFIIKVVYPHMVQRESVEDKILQLVKSFKHLLYVFDFR